MQSGWYGASHQGGPESARAADLACPPSALSSFCSSLSIFLRTMQLHPNHDFPQCFHPCGLMFSGKPSKKTKIISGLCPHLPCHPPPTSFLQSHLPVILAPMILAPGHNHDRSCPRGTRHPPPAARAAEGHHGLAWDGDNCVGPPVGAVTLGGASVPTNRIPSPQYIFVRTSRAKMPLKC